MTAQGKGLKKPVPIQDLLPDYFGTRDKKAGASKSIEEQRAEMRAWYTMYKRKEAEAKGQML